MKTGETIDELTASNVQIIADSEKAAKMAQPLGAYLADRAVRAIGSWTFLIAQAAVLLLWILWNVAFHTVWDPFPFILLNLVLSFQAAFATPMILMSENRRARMAERRHHLDLQINLLAEQENTIQLKLLRLLCEQAGIETSNRVTVLEKPVDPTTILHQIDDQLQSDQPNATSRASPLG